MKYLLSNGLVTEDKIVYMKDFIFLNILILKDEVPYFKGGSEEFASAVIEEDIVDFAKEQINGIIGRISNEFPENKVELEGIEMIDHSYISCDININNEIVTYNI